MRAVRGTDRTFSAGGARHDPDFRQRHAANACLGESLRHRPNRPFSNPRHAQGSRLTPRQTELLDLIDQIAEDPTFYVEMWLEPGEINYLKNNAVLHTHTEYEDFDEPEPKRHLVRLWLTAHDERADGDAFVRQGIPIKEGVAADADEIFRANTRMNH